MSSTIKMRADDKKQLDKLKAALLLNGISLKQEELLSRLVDLGENFLLDFDSVPMKKLSQEEKEKILSRGYKMGPTSSKTIDEELYGGN